MEYKCFISTPESVKDIHEDFGKMAKKRKNHMDFKLTETDKDKCDLVFFYCPIVSRAGTDIEAALNKINTDFSNKMVILIVLHHTFDPEIIVTDSSKFVGSRVNLTVDCLFHEDQGLLKCKRNSESARKVKKFLKSEKPDKVIRRDILQTPVKVVKADQL